MIGYVDDYVVRLDFMERVMGLQEMEETLVDGTDNG